MARGNGGDARRRTTLSDVAARAGVSPVTVSRALRDPHMVSPALRERVDAAVRELAYVPNQLASALASARTRTIGVVVPSLTNGVFADYLKALHDVLVPAGLHILVSNSRYLVNEEEELIATLLGQHPEAMIVAGIDQSPRARLLLEQAGIPVVQTMELADDPIDINIGLSQHGAVVPSLTNGVFADYLKALHDVLVPAGLHVLVSNSRYLVNEEEELIATLLGQHPEAMIVAGIDQSPRARLLLEQAGIPVVQTMELADDPIDINIGMSQHGAGYAATRYLLDLGYRRIGHTAARLDPRSRRRMEGYAEAMAEAGVDDDRFVATTPRASTVALGGELLAEVLGHAEIEALFCCNDDLALGALFECQRRGIRVPDDLAIIGFNDLEFCASAHPALSSVAIPRYAIAAQAAEIVLEIIRGSGARPDPRRMDVGFAIVERASTRTRRPEAVAPAGNTPQAAGSIYRASQRTATNR